MAIRAGDTFIETYVVRGMDHFGVDVYLVKKIVGGDTFIEDGHGQWVKNETEPGMYGPRRPSYSIHDPEQLLAGLQKLGIRAPGESAPTDIIAAKDAHLEDKRRLVFDKGSDG